MKRVDLANEKGEELIKGIKKGTDEFLKKIEKEKREAVEWFTGKRKFSRVERRIREILMKYGVPEDPHGWKIALPAVHKLATREEKGIISYHHSEREFEFFLREEKDIIISRTIYLDQVEIESEKPLKFHTVPGKKGFAGSVFRPEDWRFKDLSEWLKKFGL